jgi:hypothetical protein
MVGLPEVCMYHCGNLGTNTSIRCMHYVVQFERDLQCRSWRHCLRHRHGRTGAAARALKPAVQRLADSVPREVVDDIFCLALKKQTGVSLKYMLDFGQNPIERQLVLSAQFLHQELPVRLAHRVAELENLPYGLSAKPHVLKVRLMSLYP